MTTTTAMLTMTTTTATLTMTTTTAALTMTKAVVSRARCEICPNVGFRRNAVATQPQDPPGTLDYTCQNAQDWLNAPSTTITCARGQAYWNTACCRRLHVHVP